MNASRSLLDRGFTLVEVLIAVVVMVVLGAIAIPAYSMMLVSQRLSSHSNGFLSALHLARTEAIKRNHRVVVCKSASGADCEADGSWDAGWLVFADTNNNASVEDGEVILRRGDALGEGFVMAGNAPVAEYVSYTPLGLTKKTSGAFQAGTITLCHEASRDGEARQVVVSISGRPRVQKTRVDACS